MWNTLKVKVSGPLACFTRPDLRTDRVSYDVMTPSAAQGILRKIYWHPGVLWAVDSITVLNPIKHLVIKTNEIKSKTSMALALQYARGTSPAQHIVASKVRIQRKNRFLKDVAYLIEFHLEVDPNYHGDPLNVPKIYNITRKRIKRGGSDRTPYMGIADCPCDFEEWTGPDTPKTPFDGTAKLLERMFWGWEWLGPDQRGRPLFFDAMFVNGKIDLRGVQTYGLD